MLFDYVQTVQGFVRDRASRELNYADLVRYVNRARREIAERAQCVRILTPISGPITAIQVTAGGTGYTAPVVTISAPDSPSGALPNPAGLQATATAQQIGGVISNISVSDGGDGYFAPVVTITDPTGTGATATASTVPLNSLQFQQEVYEFSNAPISQFPGVKSIFAVKSVSIIFANYRYSLPCYDFSTYQSMIRQYPRQYIYIPTLCAQRGQGSNGSLYLYPISSATYQMEWDAFAIPSDLQTDQDYEAIPDPWTDAVAIGAAKWAFLELQAYNNARYWSDEFESYCHKFSSYARPGRPTNPYGRY